ncbi:hypothetical protein RA210_U30281 [Rubrivivax sp. A210]|nr:hypothetical protein RA210_U30281 [Rubrivivax sp. A210]
MPRPGLTIDTLRNAVHRVTSNPNPDWGRLYANQPLTAFGVELSGASPSGVHPGNPG